MTTTAVIIVAAGKGSRMGPGATEAKQWLPLAGKSVTARSIAAFADSLPDARIVLVLPQGEMQRAAGFANCVAVEGGDTRAASVLAALRALAGQGIDHVLIHDAARPLVSEDVIRSVSRALEDHVAAAPGLAVTDALWRGGETVTAAVDRSGLYRAQTPQGFHFDAILAAHLARPGTAADDVEVARAAGIEVAIVPGEERNLKLTTPGDFDRAAGYLRGDMDIRMGNGFDVHRFGPGDHVWLCGIKVPHDRGLQGHSDADVGMHAATDAIYGALAEGDIGRHFPPSDPQWKGAASHIFLSHAAGRVAERGFAITNIDVTLICEYPKIGPHAVDMQGEMARIVGLSADRVSVKATTSERLGFTGRGEGIAAIATATLVKT